MLRSWRAIGLSRRIGHKRAVTECPKSVNTFNFKVRVDPDPATLFCARDKIENRIWRYARCPDQRRTWDTDSAGELDFVTPDCCDFAFGMNLNIAFPQLLVGIASQFFAELGQNVFARMDQYDTQHLLLEFWIERQRVAQKIVNACDRFDSSESATSDDKRQ